MAPVSLDPYLNFRDNTREAMEFYHQVFGGKLDMNTFKDFGASQDPGRRRGPVLGGDPGPLSGRDYRNDLD